MSGRLSPLFTWRSAIAQAGSPLRPVARHVALTISLHMSELGDSAFPSLRTLEQETGLHRETIVRALRELEDAGFLEITRGGGRGHANRYRATVPKGSVEPILPSRGEAATTPPKGSTDPTVPSRREPATSGDTGERSADPTVPAPGAGNGRIQPRKRSAQPTRERHEDVTPPEPSAPTGPQVLPPQGGQRPRDLAFEALAEACGISLGELTRTARGALNRALAEIRAAAPELDGPELAAEIARRAEAYRRGRPEWALPPTALAKGWPALGAQVASPDDARLLELMARRDRIRRRRGPPAADAVPEVVDGPG